MIPILDQTISFGILLTHSPFHGRHELCGGLLGALRGPLRVAHEALDAARSALDTLVTERAAWEAAPRSAGRPPQWEEKIARGAEIVARASAYDVGTTST